MINHTGEIGNAAQAKQDTLRAKEIRKQIRELKAEMKADGIIRSSCFNGGHSARSYACNNQLFQLGIELDRALGKKI